MNEAPKKVWVDEAMIAWAWYSENEIPYIRADIVDKLVEALERLARLGNGNNYGNSIGNEIARAALKKLEESHD